MNSSLPTPTLREVAAPCASVIPLNLSALPHHPASMVHEWSSLHVLVVLFVSAIIFVIHDLDTPLTGASQSGQRPLLHLKTLLEQENATAR